MVRKSGGRWGKKKTERSGASRGMEAKESALGFDSQMTAVNKMNLVREELKKMTTDHCSLTASMKLMQEGWSG